MPKIGEAGSPPRVAIVGGGLAGMAAAAALATRGCRVELFEAKRKLGGRAGSYVDRVTGESIDHCQHVAMGCCTNYIDFCQRTGIDDCFSRYKTLHFFDPSGRRSDFSPSTWLPAPLHLLGPLLTLSYLTLSEKLSIMRALQALIRTNYQEYSFGCPTVLQWLHEHGQSARAIERFWQVVLVSALAESLEHASLAAARKVFVDGFLAHRDASHVLVPKVSLDELYDQRVAGWLQQQGVAIHRQSPVTETYCPEFGSRRLEYFVLGDGSRRECDFAIFAVPWTQVQPILHPRLWECVYLLRFEQMPSAPISSLHLWLDRRITALPHAVLVGRLSQWVFARPSKPDATEFYYQIVISASHELSDRERSDVRDEVLNDLMAVFPQANHAQLLRWQLITDHQAVFSMRPGLERQGQQTIIRNLCLAGDWTSTGWPATMEGAVRSGYLAAEQILKKLDRPETIMVPDLPRNWLTRRF